MRVDTVLSRSDEGAVALDGLELRGEIETICRGRMDAFGADAGSPDGADEGWRERHPPG